MIKGGLIGLTAFLLFTSSVFAGNIPDEEYMTGVVVFGLEPEHFVDLRDTGPVERLGVAALDNLFDAIGATSVEMRYSFINNPEPGKTDLRLIYNVYFPESEDVKQVCAALAKTDGVVFAEPWFIYRVFYDPNDPRRNEQYNLNLIQAARAHDIDRGSRETVIGISDTGMDMDHPDLAANLWVNPGEDLNGNGQIDQNERNGQDDDGNHAIDDFYGWDLAGNDNNPEDTYGHGTHVAGIASAVTDNRVGIASVGFHCALMIVRCGPGPQITAGDQSIAWAAQNGAKVINCSWGGYQSSEAGRQAVAAAHDRGALVVCAAGNNGSSRVSFPAGYQYAFSVAATTRDDVKADFSNYGNSVDISAPGVGILSTYLNGDYTALDGTSMASPLVAGAAAVFFNANRDFSPDDVADFLKFGADDISARNPRYNNQLGGGRLNIYRSLQIVNQPLVVFLSARLYRDGNRNGRLDPGESGSIVATVSNRGQAPDSLILRLTSEDPDIEISQPVIHCPNISRGQQYTNTDAPFLVSVAQGSIPHTTRFRIEVISYPGDQIIESDLPLLVGQPSILIIDDDGGLDYQVYLQQSIERIRLGWLNWDLAVTEMPTPDTLHWYRLVIWTTGDDANPLTDTDRWTIQTSVQQGTNVMLTGRNIGDDQFNTQLLRQVFGSQHTNDSVGAVSVMGIGGRNRPFQENVMLSFEGLGGSGDGTISPSAMSLTRDGDSAFVYYYQGRPNGLAGSYKVNVNTGAKALYCGFTFEAISDSGFSQARALERIVGWFCPDLAAPPSPAQPDGFMLSAAFPNPFNGSVRLNYYLQRPGRTALTIYDVNGHTMAILDYGEKEPGSYSLVWNAAEIPSGVYFARLKQGGNQEAIQRLILVR